MKPQKKPVKWMPTQDHLRYFVKTTDEIFEGFFIRHGFSLKKKASSKALRVGLIRVNSKGKDEWSVNMFLRFWIEDRDNNLLKSIQAKKDGNKKKPYRRNEMRRTPVDIKEYRTAVDTRIHSMLNGIPFNPFELDKFREKVYVKRYPYSLYVETCEMTGNIPMSEAKFQNTITRTIEEREAQ